MKRYLIFIVSVNLTVASFAQDFLGDMIDAVTELHENYELDLDAFRAPTPEEWSEFWGLVETTLQADSMEDLADLLPYAQVALGYLDQFPEAKPYADWLRNQMDYFTMADEVVREEQRSSPMAHPQRRPPLTKKPDTIIPPIRKPVSPAPPPSSSQSVDVERWMKRLGKRPAPKGSATYVPRLKPVFAEEGVPEELVWLAEVESSFNPDARSPVGAMGMYQFMPATAERFGLSLKPHDERLVPERSAFAAAKYLKFLHNKFNSWPLALAAYNAGEGRVGRLLKKHKGASFEDIQRYLPSETRMYVPKIDAVVRIREGSSLATL